jgi:glycosyltransferase involved in cell wall biosynthesis
MLHYWREGLPISLIEAAACGLPLIASDFPGCRKVITDGVDGLLVPVRDSTALPAAISRLDDDRKLARQLGQAAHENVLANLDGQIVIQKTIAVYDEILSSTRENE